MKRTDDIVDPSLYAALFQDIAAWDPDLHKPLVRDYERIVDTITSRGLSFIMIDLPDAGRYIDACLSRGVFDSSKLPITFGKVDDNGKRPFLASLISKVFDGDGTIVSHPDLPTSVFFLRSVLYLAKKVDMACKPCAVLAEVEQFKEIDESLREPLPQWNSEEVYGFTNWRYRDTARPSFLDGWNYTSSYDPSLDLAPRPALLMLECVADRLALAFGALDWREIVPKHGPGAVCDAKTGTDKYSFPHWPEKLESMFPFSYFAQHREDLHHTDDVPLPSPKEYPAKLLAVPKTLKGPRMIASEPVAHQFIQLGLMKWFREHLPKPLRESIDFTSQEPSRALCLKASKTSEYATVDLSAASDRLSCWVVERMFRTNEYILDALWASRTTKVTNGTSVGPQWTIALKKFAPMGSGVTFPVQTICYAIISIAVLLYLEGRSASQQNILLCAKKIRVYGDDIILPSYAVPALAHLLQYLQLKVNVSKTHYMGFFRESCGMDAFMGIDVTPVYASSLVLGDEAKNLESWIEVSNNAYSKGLWCLSDFMVRSIPARIRSKLPISTGTLGCLSLRSFQDNRPNGKLRFNRVLFRDEVLGICIDSKLDKRGRDSFGSLLQYFLEKPHPTTKWASGWIERKRFVLKKRWVPWYLTKE